MKLASLAVVAALAAACAGPRASAPSSRPGAGTEAGAQPASRAAPPARAAALARAAATAPAAPTAPPLMPDEAFRARRPEALPVQPHFDAPTPVQRRLRNGARVLVVENHALPLVAIDVLFLHGSDTEPLDRAGLSDFATDLVDEGTQSRSATALAAQIEDLAANLGASAGRETSGAHLNCLAETLPQAVELLADIVLHPAFRPEDVERVRRLRLAELGQKKAYVGALAADEAARLLYGEGHPWGQPSGGTPQTLLAISREDLAAWHRATWVANDAVISVAGDVRPDEVVRLLEEKFAGWPRARVRRPRLPPLPPLSRFVSALDKPRATQSQVWAIGRLFPARDRDALPLRLGNLPLGGLFTSRLNLNLREQHGYSYGAGSRVSLQREVGAFAATSGVEAAHTVEALAEIEKELLHFAGGNVTEGELASAKQAFVRGIPAALETDDALAGAMANLVSLRLPLDYYQTLPARVQATTLQDVNRAVARWLRPAEWPVVIVGPVGQSRAALEKLGLGEVRLRPAPGVEPPGVVPAGQSGAPPHP